MREAVGIATRFLSRYLTTSFSDVQNDNTQHIRKIEQL